MTDHVGRGDVEQECAAREEPVTLADVGGERGERPTGRQLVELHHERNRGIRDPHEHHRRRHHPPIGRVASGGDDRLAEHLASLDDTAPMVGADGRDEGGVAVGSNVHDVDQVGGVAPRRELLDGDVALVVAGHRVDELDRHGRMVLVERDVAGRRRRGQHRLVECRWTRRRPGSTTPAPRPPRRGGAWTATWRRADRSTGPVPRTGTARTVSCREDRRALVEALGGGPWAQAGTVMPMSWPRLPPMILATSSSERPSGRWSTYEHGSARPSGWG